MKRVEPIVVAYTLLLSAGKVPVDGGDPSLPSYVCTVVWLRVIVECTGL